jgi:membrane protein
MGVESAFWRSLIHNVRWVIIFGLIFYIVAFLYRHGPSLERRWPFLTPGSIFATSMMIIATGIVSYWVNNFSNYNKLYGSISAIFVLMSLIYVNSLAVLLGFELNVTLTRLQIEKRPKPAAAPVKG